LVSPRLKVNDVNEKRGNRDPEELVPIEEGESKQMRLAEVVERHPQQGDKRHQQKKRPWAQRFFGRRSHFSGKELQEFSLPKQNQDLGEEQVRKAQT
jgi:hypothetical protein